MVDFKKLTAELNEEIFWDTIDKKPDIDPANLDLWYRASEYVGK